MSAPELPHRLTPTERLHEVTMAAMHRAPAPPESSVSLSRNAKGVAQFEVVVRGADAEACKREAAAIFDHLATIYPYPVASGAE